MYNTPFHPGDISNSSFLVAGGAGFIGSHIVEYLVTFGAGRVVVLDDLSTGDKANIEAFINQGKVELIEGDITRLDDCHRACRGIDYISHQAALGSVPRSLKHPEATHAANSTGFVNMLIAAKEAGVKRMVYASSSSVYGDSPDLPKVEDNIGEPLSPYAVSKRTNELYAKVFYRNYGLETIGLRYFNVFGPRQKPDGPYAAVIPLFVNNLLTDQPVYIDGDGEQTRDFTFVENAVQANIRALFAGEDAVNKLYNVAVGENFSVNYLFNKIAEHLNVPANAEHRAPRKGDVRNSLADISLAQKLLAYQPGVRFEDGLKTTVDYFRTLVAG